MPSVESSREKLVIIGTGSFAEEVADITEETGKYEVAAFIEHSNRERSGHSLLGRSIVWIEEAASFASTHKAVCALGMTHRGDVIRRAFECGFQFATIVHPGARISRRSSVDEGSIINAGAVIASHVKVGKHVIINRGCLIGHHTTIGDYVTVSPGSNIAAAVTIGEGAFIGIGAIIVNNVDIGVRSFIGAGSVVTGSIPDRVQVLGSPARIFKRDIEGN